ncbi:hypothetical protein M406DRAFT_256727 [Cryphonectria parasitica EP155]|uniref:Uncharacterized protein n=1 Tax=Cryphonectria parasitica (strain ATCC 38755 / EP155) TaxID=660469 RepID=A0A9P4Y5R8_CRYP1|nr:uncharacterized protein M406DRAFT_256727 [Cryphonectria parasitica EP155]KAF3766620.1 hypothetical protein M406DRAFT_256727 [Cryphonectria parasitica EP155]
MHDLAFLIEISNRINKSRSHAEKTRQKDSLLSLVLQNAIIMPSCSFYKSHSIQSCQVSIKDSSRCAECIRLGRSRCDIQGLSAAEIRWIGIQYQRLENQLESAKEQLRNAAAEIGCLQKQKRLWFERMIKAIC